MSKKKSASSAVSTGSPTRGSTDMVLVPLTQIHADKKWNARFGFAGSNEERAGQEGLFLSIQERGQDEPVTLCPAFEGSTHGMPYELVAGFGRFEAVSKLAAMNETKDPTIKAVIEQYNESGARARNVRENTARNDMRPADVAWGILQMSAMPVGENEPQWSDTRISIELGLTQSYVSMLHRIARDVKEDLFRHWRQSVSPVEVKLMDRLAKYPKKEQPQIYQDMVEGMVNRLGKKAAEGDGEDGGDADASTARKYEKAKDKARLVGEMFAKLTAFDHLDCSKLEFAACLDIVMKIPAKFNAKMRRTLAGIAERAYAAEITSIAEEAEEEAKRQKEEARAAEAN